MLYMPSLLFVASSLAISSVGASFGMDVADLPSKFSPERNHELRRLDSLRRIIGR